MRYRIACAILSVVLMSDAAAQNPENGAAANSLLTAASAAQLLAAVIGGLIAAGTGAYLQSRLERLRLNKLRDLFLRAVEDDLSNASALYEKLEEDWKKTKTVWFATTQELTASRKPITDHPEYLVLLDDPRLRNRISRYYLRSGQRLGLLESNQRRKYELDGKYWDTLRQIRVTYPELDESAAKEEAKSRMETEAAEYSGIDKISEATLQELRDSKAEANALLEEIRRRAGA